MIATGLHLDEGAGAAVDAIHKMRCGLADRHDVIDLHAGRFGDIQSYERLGLHLLRIADHARDFRHFGERSRVDLGGASGHDDGRVRPLAPRPADGLARLPYGFRGHRAGVDDHGIGEPGRFGVATHDFRFIGVQPASQRQKRDARLLGSKFRSGWNSCNRGAVCHGGGHRLTVGQCHEFRPESHDQDWPPCGLSMPPSL